MKTKFKIIIQSLITSILIAFVATSVFASGLNNLKSLQDNTSIGKTYSLGYQDLVANNGNTGLYCIQHGKELRSAKKLYTLKNYVEIYGNTAKVYSTNSKNENAKEVVSELNGQVAYILNLKQGYGPSTTNTTKAQNALWHVSNNWVTTLFGSGTDYAWSKNAKVGKNSINDAAATYAKNIPSSSSTDSSTTLKLINRTDKDAITKTYVDGYYRIGPFKWEFDGKVTGIEVTGKNGQTISNSNLRIIQYSGDTASSVSADQLVSNKDFYIDVKYTNNTTGITKIKISNSDKSNSQNEIYTAKIWFLKTADYQNLIYVDVGKDTPQEKTNSDSMDIEDEDTNFGLYKIDDRGKNPMRNVGFKLHTYVLRNFPTYTGYTDDKGIYHTIKHDHWKWVERWLDSGKSWNAESESAGYEFKTDKNGQIDLSGMSSETTRGGIKAVETSNPYYGYDVGQTYDISVGKFENHQKLVKVSGFVWVENKENKSTTGNNVADSGEHGFNYVGHNGVTVHLKDKQGNDVKPAQQTSDLGLYDIVQGGGEYQFVDVDLDKLQAGEYHVEFEYCGLIYQAVNVNMSKSNKVNNDSTATETITRSQLNNKFTSVDGNGTQNLNINGVTVNYTNTNEFKSSIASHDGDIVVASTAESKYTDTGAQYQLYDDFIPTHDDESGEVKYVNLGLYEKAQADYALAQDLYNVKVDINNNSHIYKYKTVRYNADGSEDESTWDDTQVGVKFQKNNGVYARAIYKADYEYATQEIHKNEEIRANITYIIALKNQSPYLARINSIVDYSDNQYTLTGVGTKIEDSTSTLSGGEGIQVSNDGPVGDYTKYTLSNLGMVIPSGETRNIYIQFNISRQKIIELIGSGEALNNVAEIESYSTFEDNDTSKPLAVVDLDSVPGNTIPGKVETYEDDTDSARSLKFELREARKVSGTVFIDNIVTNGNSDVNSVMTGKERKGNGLYDSGEKTLPGVKVTLTEIKKDNSYNDSERTVLTTTTDENGNFIIKEGIKAADYVLTYTWGDKTYKVQYYKGTIYDESRDQSDKSWWRTQSPETRKTDALDDMNQRKIIDDEMEKVTNNTLEAEIQKAYEGGSNVIKTTTMNSNTPQFTFGVEYNNEEPTTTSSDGTTTVDNVKKYDITNVDFGIVERPKQKVAINKKVSKYKITLANGQVLVDANYDEKNNKFVGSVNNTTMPTPEVIKTEIDNEILQGAKMEVTYKITATNISEKDFTDDAYYLYGTHANTPLKLSMTNVLDYLDRKVSKVDDDQNSKWTEITDGNKLMGTASDSGINSYQKQLQNNNLENLLNDSRVYDTSDLSNPIATGESNTVTINASTELTTSNDNTFNNNVEITNIKKPENTNNSGSPVLVQVDTHSLVNLAQATAPQIVIMPSTGENKNIATPIILGIVLLIIVGAGTFVIKKFVIDK